MGKKPDEWDPLDNYLWRKDVEEDEEWFRETFMERWGCERAMKGIVYPCDEYGMDLDLDDLDPDTFY